MALILGALFYGFVKSLGIANIQFSHPVISMGYEIDFCGF
jgi:hypothetical protein